MTEVNEPQRIAHHEAGHAVFQYLFGWEIRFLGVGRLAEEGQHDWSGGATGEKGNRHDGAVIAYAGPLAEARYLGVDLTDDHVIKGHMPDELGFDGGRWEGDAEIARHFAGNHTANCLKRARTSINRNDVWLAIVALAVELCWRAEQPPTRLGELSAEVRQVVLPGLHTTNHDHRSARCAVITGDEVRQIVKSVNGMQPPAKSHVGGDDGQSPICMPATPAAHMRRTKVPNVAERYI